MKPKIYFIDIDETVCFTPENNGVRLYEQSTPYLDRINKINTLYNEGHYIKYWTARGSSSGLDWFELTKKQLKEWGCKYHEFSVGKPSYDFFVCDKAINSEDFFSECNK